MSQAVANQMMRVLNGQKLKLTVTVHHKDGSKTEWQSDVIPDIHYDNETRQRWIVETPKIKDCYTKYPVMEWKEGDIIRVEENEPKAQ